MCTPPVHSPLVPAIKQKALYLLRSHVLSPAVRSPALCTVRPWVAGVHRDGGQPAFQTSREPLETSRTTGLGCPVPAVHTSIATKRRALEMPELCVAPGEAPWGPVTLNTSPAGAGSQPGQSDVESARAEPVRGRGRGAGLVAHCGDPSGQQRAQRAGC